MNHNKTIIAPLEIASIINSFSKDVKMRCLLQRAIPTTIMIAIERKEAIPNAQRKY